MNFQDVIRESYDDSNKALKVNTVAGGLGQATVAINGIVNSIATIANVPLDTQIVGNVTLSGSLPTGINKIGFATVAVSNPTLYAVVNTAAAGVENSIVTVANIPLDTRLIGNVTLSDSKKYIGLVSISGSVEVGTPTIFVGTPTLHAVVNTETASSSNVTLDPGSRTGIVGNITIDSGTITTITNPVALKGNVTLDAGSKTQIVGNITLSGSLPAGVNNIGFATVSVSNPTLYAVVNTGAAGVQNSMVTINPRTDYFGLVSVSGNVNIGTPTVFVGTPTLYAIVNTAAAGVGNSIVTVANTPLPTQIIGNVTINSGTVGLAAGVNNIGFASVTVINTSRSIAGNITIDSGVITTITNPVGIKGNITINSGTITAVTNITNPIALKGNVTLSDSKTFIGSVTAWSRNAGTTKTLIPKTIELSTSSVATIAVATAIWKMTHLLLSSNATTRVSIKSGATYLTGNASIGITLLPGGGWVENGSPDSPIYVGLAAQQAIVVEKLDLTGTSALVGGKVIYFDE